jgi:LuxR family maltose regulon positive regulatory protein
LIPKLQSSNQRRRLLKANIIQAIALGENGQIQKALELLIDILPLAEKENYIRIWLEMHPKVRELLVKALKEYETNYRNQSDYSTILEYGRRVLQSFEQKFVHSPAKPGDSRVVDLSFEELTNREQEVLSLLASGLTTSHIAESLTISSSTAKTHVRNIYQKLGVNSRKHAVDRAKELQLIEPI